MNTIIEVKSIAKKFNIYPKGRPYKILQEDILFKVKSLFNKIGTVDQKKAFWALRNISFSAEKGDVIGIIGKNGSGKSTLLKILGGITLPTKGEAIIRGKVSSLLEAGPGFHLELTGSENIYLNGIILGIPKKLIQEKFNNIVKFSGIGKFINIPVKYYSTGMYVRLAFSISAYLNPDILLLDEILSVGDAEFQKASLKKVKEQVLKRNLTVILVSHNMEHIKEFCKSVILLDKGKIIKVGYPNEVVNYYLKINQ